MKTFLERGTLQQAERIFADSISALPQLPPLGPSFKSLTGCELRDALVVHRIVSQFSIKGSEDQVRDLEAAGFRKMLHYDASHSPFNWWDLDHKDRVTFIGAQEFIKTLVKGFKPTYRVKFPKNETHVSANGDTSLYTKLADLGQWTVSSDCLEYATKVVWHNQALRKMVKTHFREKFKDDGLWRVLLSCWRKSLPDGLSDGAIGYRMVGKMFRTLVTIVGTSRLSSVAKSNTARRVITMEPMWNMVCQLSMSLDLRDCLVRGTGFSLSWLQTWHRERIASGDATIDFSNASNSNWWDVIQQLWPRHVTKHLSVLRTGIAENRGTYYPLQMMAPMGCGFTFEVMTITLLAYARQFCPRSTVFGDDVIMSPEGAPGFIKFASNTGWIVNEAKTFIDGNFRESCGAFYDLADRRYLLSYDFPPFDDQMDLVVTLNKLRDLWLNGGLGTDLRQWLIETWVKIARLVPTELFSFPQENLQGATVDYRPLSGNRRCRRTSLAVLRQQQLQLQRVVELCHVRLVKRQRYLRQDDEDVGHNASIAAFRFSNTVPKRTVRTDALSYEWCDDHGLINDGLTLYSVEADRDRFMAH